MSQKIPDAPITRSELYDAREIELLEQIAEGGLGPSVTVEPLSVTENGTYSEQGKAYSPVTVAVPEPVLDELEVTQNGTYTPVHDGYSEVTVNVPTGGGGGEPMRDVNFYDYDGTILYSYSAADFLALSAMPENPSHDGLTAQGWNWSFADAQDYVSRYGMLEIGQMYITDDGKTRIYIHLEEGRLSPYLGICPNGSVDIDWGDGSAHDTVTGTNVSTVVNTQHTYAAAGDYVIKLTVTGEMGIKSNGSYSLLLNDASGTYRDTSYRLAIYKIEFGQGITNLGDRSLAACNNIRTVSIPIGLTQLGSSAFAPCFSLRFVTLPSGLNNLNSSFGSMFTLLGVSIPNGVRSSGTFGNCYSLKRISLPGSVSTMDYYAFQNCYTLKSVVIPKSVKTINGNAFEGCRMLSHVELPENADSLGDSVFSGCHDLKTVLLPNKIKNIRASTFASCYSLSSITFPEMVNSIAATAFSYAYSLRTIRFTSTTPPTVSNSNAFTNLPTDCVIYVPTGTLSAYTSATNYPSASTYTYVEY